MRYEITFGVELDRNNQRLSDLPDRLMSCQNQAAKEFGGYSCLSGGSGGWLNPEGDLILEPTVSFVIDYSGPRGNVIAFVRFVGVEFNQHSVHLAEIPCDAANIEIFPDRQILGSTPEVNTHPEG